MTNLTIKKYNDIINQAYLQIKSGNRKQIEDILKIAQKKYAYAEYILGKLNEEDFKNMKEAMRWYEFASVHGSAKAQKRFADLLLFGDGVDVNIEKAILYYKKSAIQNNAEAQYMLGEIYEVASYISDDYKNMAQEWYQKAYINGFATALVKLYQTNKDIT